MKIIKAGKFLSKIMKKCKISGIATIFEKAIIRNDQIDNQRIIKHEGHHIDYQMKRDGKIKYIKNWTFGFIKNLIKYKNVKKAYKNIPYEIEARKAEWS